MLDPSTVAVIGWVAVGMSMCSYIPQAYIVISTRKTDGISLSGFLIIFGSLICWFIYGLAQGDYPLIISCAVSLLSSGTILAFLLYRRIPVILTRFRNRKAAADIGLFATDNMPSVMGFNKKTRFLHPRRLRKHKRPQK